MERAHGTQPCFFSMGNPRIFGESMGNLCFLFLRVQWANHSKILDLLMGIISSIEKVNNRFGISMSSREFAC